MIAMEYLANAYSALKDFIANFNMAVTSSDTKLFIIVWGIYLGVMAAIVLSLISRVYSHRLVSALVREKAADPSSARSFESLGIKKSFIYSIIFRKSSPLRKYVKYNGTEMYLPEDKRIGAELRFSEEKHPIVTLVLSAIVFFVIACLALVFIPEMISAYSKIGK